MPGGLHHAWSSASLWIRQVDGAGAVARKAIDRIGGERAQISHAADHSGSSRRNGVTVKAITMPAAPCIAGVAGVVVVGIVTHIGVRGALGSVTVFVPSSMVPSTMAPSSIVAPKVWAPVPEHFGEAH